MVLEMQLLLLNCFQNKILLLSIIYFQNQNIIAWHASSLQVVFIAMQHSFHHNAVFIHSLYAANIIVPQ